MAEERKSASKTTNIKKKEETRMRETRKVTDGTVTISQDPTLQGYARLLEAIMTPGATVQENETIEDILEKAKLQNEFPWNEASVWVDFIKGLYARFITTGRGSAYYLEEFLNENLPHEMWENEDFVLNLPKEMLWGEHSIPVAGLLANEKFVLEHTCSELPITFYLRNFHEESEKEQFLQMARNVPTHKLIHLLKKGVGRIVFQDVLKHIRDENDPYMQALKSANAEVYETVITMLFK